MSKKGKVNKYKKKDEKANHLKNFTNKLDTKGNIKNTAIETGKDILIGVVGGGLIGAAIGKPSLIVGIGVTGAGHYTGNRMATLLGIGMMAANGFQQSKSVQGLDGLDIQSIKNRIAAYKDNFMEKTYLDKVMHPKAPAAPKNETNGFGELQFFNPSNDMNGPNMNDELSALQSIERQIAESGMSHMQMTGKTVGDFDEVGELSIVDASDYNL